MKSFAFSPLCLVVWLYEPRINVKHLEKYGLESGLKQHELTYSL